MSVKSICPNSVSVPNLALNGSGGVVTGAPKINIFLAKFCSDWCIMSQLWDEKMQIWPNFWGSHTPFTEPHRHSKFRILQSKIVDDCRLEKIKRGHISTTVWPVGIEFGTVMFIDPMNHIGSKNFDGVSVWNWHLTLSLYELTLAATNTTMHRV